MDLVFIGEVVGDMTEDMPIAHKIGEKEQKLFLES
jgi:hypothetical protein